MLARREIRKQTQSFDFLTILYRILNNMLKKPPKLRSIIKSKAKGNINVRPASDAMVELLTLVFLNNLAEEAMTKACEEKCGTIRGSHVKAASKEILKKSRG